MIVDRFSDGRIDRVWGDVRLAPVGYANDFDGDGLGSIDFGVVGSLGFGMMCDRSYFIPKSL